MASLIENRRRILLNSPHPERLTGDLLTFRTDMAVKLPEVMVQILPVQDLHGYEFPYPPGGGKNLFNKNATDTSKGYISGQYINSSGSAVTPSSGVAWNTSEYIPVEPSTTYTLTTNRTFSSSAPSVCWYDSSKNYISGMTYSNTSVRTFTLPSNAAYVRVSIPVPETDTLQLEKGSRSTSYASYANICPIYGWDWVNVVRTGANVWNEEWELGTYSATTGQQSSATDRIRNKYPIPTLPNIEYYIGSSVNATFGVFFYDTLNAFISVSWVTNNTFTTPANCAYMNFAGATAYYGTTYNNDISINYPSTDTSYHAYQGTVIPVSWQSDAGTVYKALLNLLTGEFLVTHAIADLGALEWERNTEYGFFATVDPITGAKLGEQGNVSDIYCSHYEKGLISTDKRINVDVSGRACISDSAYSDATTFAASLSGVQLVYELASPVEHQLSEHQLSALKGVNNIWATAGTVSVKYWTH